MAAKRGVIGMLAHVALVAGWPSFTETLQNGASLMLMSRTNINGQGLCNTGVYMTEQIHANHRGENPDVGVGLISRFPMLDPTERYMSWFHTYCAVVLVAVIFINFAGPKGNDPVPARATRHMIIGRVVSWFIAPHYAIVGLVLNYFAVMSPTMEDWTLGTDLTGWRGQLAYITPFGLNTLVIMFMGFYLNRYSWMTPRPFATVLKCISAVSVVFWCTIGVYMQGSQILGFQGAFGLPIEKVLDGAALVTTENIVWFRLVAFLTFLVGCVNAFFDIVCFMILSIVEETGNSEIAWKDMHKWCMLQLSFNAGFIFGFFVGAFPYCSFGLPEWTCLPIGAAAGVCMAFIWPFLWNIRWVYNFLVALLNGTIKEFSAPNHEWDGMIEIIRKKDAAALSLTA